MLQLYCNRIGMPLKHYLLLNPILAWLDCKTYDRIEFLSSYKVRQSFCKGWARDGFKPKNNNKGLEWGPRTGRRLTSNKVDRCPGEGCG